MGFSVGSALGGENTSWRDVAAGVAVLTLATTGNAILPIPYAFAISGAVASTLIIVGVALGNVFTCKLLLRGAVSTGAADYEQLAFAIGGKWLQIWSEIWIVVLLVGTNIGGIIQMGEAFSFAVSSQWPDAPTWLWGRSGTAAMLFFTLCVIFPLSMLPKMRKLEMVGNGGVLILFGLVVVVMVKAIQEGFPALASGDFAHVSSGDLSSISETFSLLCFAFYHQMPRVSSDAARRNAKALHRASTITILGTSGLYYWFTGFFGASVYGATNISDNLLGNVWLPGVGTFILNLIVTFYLSISIPPIFHATNHTVDRWLRGLLPGAYGGLTRPWVQRLIVNCVTIFTCLGVALGVPGESGTVLSVTGATGVSMCSYILPVVFHFALYFGKARCMLHPDTNLPNTRCSTVLPPPAVEAMEAGGSASAPMLSPSLTLTDSPRSNAAEGDVGAKQGSQDASSEQKLSDDPFQPHPDAPPGLYFAYYKKRSHRLVALGYDIVMPLLVCALGCFFSVATLVLLFQPSSE